MNLKNNFFSDSISILVIFRFFLKKCIGIIIIVNFALSSQKIVKSDKIIEIVQSGPGETGLIMWVYIFANDMQNQNINKISIFKL